MDPVKHATEVFGMVTAEVTSLKAQPDLDPLQKARVVAQLCAVAMQSLALCHADYKHANDWHMRQKLKQGAMTARVGGRRPRHAGPGRTVQPRLKITKQFRDGERPRSLSMAATAAVTQPTDTDGDGWQVPTNENYKTISIRAPAKAAETGWTPPLRSPRVGGQAPPGSRRGVEADGQRLLYIGRHGG